MNVSLPTPLEEFIRQKVATGDFSSVDEVVCEGLRLLQRQEVWNADARRKIDVGWEQAKTGQTRSQADAQQSLNDRKEAWMLEHGK